MDVGAAVELGQDAHQHAEPGNVAHVDQVEHAVVEARARQQLHAAAAILGVADHGREQPAGAGRHAVDLDRHVALAVGQGHRRRHQEIGDLAQLLQPARLRGAMADGGRQPQRHDQVAEAIDRPTVEPRAAHAHQVDGLGPRAGGRIEGAAGSRQMAERAAELVGGAGRHRTEHGVGLDQPARAIEQAVQGLVRRAVAAHGHEAADAPGQGIAGELGRVPGRLGEQRLDRAQAPGELGLDGRPARQRAALAGGRVDDHSDAHGPLFTAAIN